MKKIGLTIYALNVFHTGKYHFEKKHGHLTFIDMISAFSKQNAKQFDIDNHAENIFKVNSFEVECVKDEDGHIIFNAFTGVVKTGEYGTEAELIHTKTRKLTHKKTVEEAEVIPFAFYLALSPIRPERGILIFQTEGRSSMKSAFEHRMKKFVRHTYEGWNFSLETLMPKEYVEHYLVDGVLQELRMIKYGISQDISERNGIRGNDEAVYEERIIHNPLGFLEKGADKIREVLRGQRSLCEVVSVSDFDYDCLKFKFRLGKTEKTIDIGNLDALIVTEDITDQAGVKTGHPDVDILKSEMRETAKEYMRSMGLA